MAAALQRCRHGVESSSAYLHAVPTTAPSLPPHPLLNRDYPADLRALWLHARSYSFKGDAGWSFAAEPPEWASPGWVPQAAGERRRAAAADGGSE